MSKASRDWKRYIKYTSAGCSNKRVSLSKYRVRRRKSNKTRRFYKRARVVPYWSVKYRKAGILEDLKNITANRLYGWGHLGEAHDCRFWPNEPVVLGSTVVSQWEHINEPAESWLWDSYKILISIDREDSATKYTAFTNFGGQNRCLGVYRDLPNAQRRCERDYRERDSNEYFYF